MWQIHCQRREKISRVQVLLLPRMLRGHCAHFWRRSFRRSSFQKSTSSSGRHLSCVCNTFTLRVYLLYLLVQLLRDMAWSNLLYCWMGTVRMFRSTGSKQRLVSLKGLLYIIKYRCCVFSPHLPSPLGAVVQLSCPLLARTGNAVQHVRKNILNVQ